MKKAPVELSHVPDPIQLSASHWFEFETEVLSQEESLDSLHQINRDLLAQIAAMDSPHRVLLDIDGQTPVRGEQEHRSCNAHGDPISRHPFLQFNGEGKWAVENLRPENVPSAEHCDEAPLPEVKHGQERSLDVVGPDDGAFAKPETHEMPEKPEVMQTFPSGNWSVPESPSEGAIYQACGAVVTAGRALVPPWPPAGAGMTTTPRLRPIRLHKPWWIAVAAVVTALGIVLIAYSNRLPASPLGTELQKSNALEQQVPFVSSTQLPTNSTTTPQTAAVAAEGNKITKTRHRRVRVRGNEVDIGEDVTVRYLAPQQSAVPPTRTVPSASKPADSSLPQAEVSSSPKLAR